MHIQYNITKLVSPIHGQIICLPNGLRRNASARNIKTFMSHSLMIYLVKSTTVNNLWIQQLLAPAVLRKARYAVGP